MEILELPRVFSVLLQTVVVLPQAFQDLTFDFVAVVVHSVAVVLAAIAVHTVAARNPTYHDLVVVEPPVLDAAAMNQTAFVSHASSAYGPAVLTLLMDLHELCEVQELYYPRLHGVMLDLPDLSKSSVYSKNAAWTKTSAAALAVFGFVVAGSAVAGLVVLVAVASAFAFESVAVLVAAAGMSVAVVVSADSIAFVDQKIVAANFLYFHDDLAIRLRYVRHAARFEVEHSECFDSTVHSPLLD